MNIYISGISGTGMGPLALMAKAAGLNVCGSDKVAGAILPELKKAKIEVAIGEQDGTFLREKLKKGIDWFVYTSALPEDHPELAMAKEAGIKCTKRDDLTAYLVDKLNLKMVAVAGTHGKTTTTAMIVWAGLKLGLPMAYIVGTTLGFAPSGAYHEGDKYFVYEADEYDRNFLKFHPWIAVITCVSYDHPDIYLTWDDYAEAFAQFEDQSDLVLEDTSGKEPSDEVLAQFKLAGKMRRNDARFATGAVKAMAPYEDGRKIIEIINDFPGVGRRFERLADGIYSDYAHHPEEIEATIDVALDEAKLRGYKGVVVVYQPHQNVRQHEVRDGYVRAFKDADKVLWLPTYLVREDPKLKILTPEELSAGIDSAEVAELNDELFREILDLRDEGYLVVLMTAGPADEWLREKLKK